MTPGTRKLMAELKPLMPQSKPPYFYDNLELDCKATVSEIVNLAKSESRGKAFILLAQLNKNLKDGI